MTEHQPTIRDLCRRWRHTEAKLKADNIILDEEAFNRRIEEVEAELTAIEAQIIDADPRDGGANAAAEILHVVIELVAEGSNFDGRDTALLRQALAVLAWAEPQPAQSAA